jgi:hypothetical protein
VASFQSPGARATPPPAPTPPRGGSGLGAFHFDKPPSAVLVLCHLLDAGVWRHPRTSSKSLGRFVTSWGFGWTPRPLPRSGRHLRQRQPQTANKESNQSVSGSERKPRKGRRLKHILDTALPCDAKLNSDGFERIKSPLLSYRRR